jgi:hypothetical protein
MSVPVIFEFAEMSRIYRMMTSIYFVIAIVLAYAAPVPGPWVACLMLFLAIGVWFYMRPQSFEVNDEFLVIRWPWRTRRIGRADIEATRRVAISDLGSVARVGVGGLWGAFGLFVTSREGSVAGYFCNSDKLLFIKLKGSRSLLISPEDPAGFLKHLEDEIPAGDRNLERMP